MKSSRACPGDFDSGMQRRPSQMAPAATGRLRKKTTRHDQAVISHPPSSGPRAVVTPDNPAQAPIARPCSSSAKLDRRTARLPGMSNAAPTPCTARAATRAPIEGARPQAAEASANQATPATNVFLCPSASPSDPPSSSSAVSVSRYASTVHCSPDMPACSSRSSTGSATLTAVESRKARPEPSTVASKSPRPRPLRRRTVTSANLAAPRRGRAARRGPAPGAPAPRRAPPPRG